MSDTAASPAPRALVVDFGGVLTTPLQDSMAAFAQSIGIELQDFVRVALVAYSGGEDSLVTRFETGQIDENEFSLEMASRIGAQTGIEVDPEGLVRRIFAGIRLENDMLDLIAEVRGAGFATALLSNSWGADLYPRDALAGLFDHMVISGEVGLRKPDPAIFELMCELLKLTPDRCVFVDDHPGHLEAAARLGMTAVLHRDPATTIAEVKPLFGLG